MHQIEVKVLLNALSKIQFESDWTKDSVFGETCHPAAKQLTLGCALKLAQQEVRGKVLNRSKEMGVVRRLIYFHYFWRAWIHPITYFNSNRRTKHSEVIGILQRAIKNLE